MSEFFIYFVLVLCWIFIVISLLILPITFIIDKYHIPAHRWIKYRIVKRYETFESFGNIREYSLFYIQERVYFIWKDVKDDDDEQRQGNTFETVQTAKFSLEELIKKRELAFQVKKAKKADEIIDISR